MINENQQDWIFLEVKINLTQFLIKFKSVSSFYRLLSNGNYLFNGKPNRIFFKTNFNNGFYKKDMSFIMDSMMQDMSKDRQE